VRRVSGLNGLVEGPLDDPAVKQRALHEVRQFVAK
jgi:hypothetical protein